MSGGSNAVTHTCAPVVAQSGQCQRQSLPGHPAHPAKRLHIVGVVVVVLDVVVVDVVVVVVVVVLVVVLVDVVVLVVLVVVVVDAAMVVLVVVGHTSVTKPPPVVTAGCTQFSSTSFCGEPPSGHAPALASAAANLARAFVMHAVSSGSALFAAFE